MFNPFRMFCFAPDGVPDGAPATDAENEREQHDDQQPETTEQTGDAAAKAAQTAAPAGKEQPVPKDEPKKDDNKADDLAARVVTANARAVQAELRTAAALAGVPKERIPYVLRMCDTEGIDLDAAAGQARRGGCQGAGSRAGAARRRGYGQHGQLCPQKRRRRGRARRKDSGEHHGCLLRKRGKEDGEQHCKG